MSSAMVWQFLQWLHASALSLWIGGIAVISFIVAPSVHRSMASRAIAGEIVGKVLRGFNRVEIVCFLILLATSFASFRFIDPSKKSLLVLGLALILLMGSFAGFYGVYLTSQMDSIKEQTSTLESLSDTHPSKVEFKKLHKLYVLLFFVNLILGLLVLYGTVLLFR